MQRQRTHTERDITMGPRRLLGYPRRLLGALISAMTLAVITACSGSGPTDATEEAVAAAVQQAREDAGLELPAQPTVDLNSERLDGVTQQWHATVTVAVTGSESPQVVNSLLGDIEARLENEDEVDVVDLNLESERVLAESISSTQGGRVLALHHALDPFDLTARATIRSSWLAILVEEIDASTAELAAGLFGEVDGLFRRVELEDPNGQRLLIEQEGARSNGWMSTWERVKQTPAVRLFSIEAHHSAVTNTQKTTASMTVEVTDPQTSSAAADELWPAIDEALRHYPTVQIIDATDNNQDTQVIHGCLSENPIQPSGELYRELSNRALSDC